MPDSRDERGARAHAADLQQLAEYPALLFGGETEQQVRVLADHQSGYAAPRHCPVAGSRKKVLIGTSTS